jgi:phytoene synthase
MDEDLDALIRRVDPDRWMSSRFVADPAARVDLVTLYALDHELARIPLVVSNPLMGEIRLTWWREGLEEIAAGKPPRPHPVLRAVADGGLPVVKLAELAEARLGDLDGESGAELLAGIDATHGLVAAIAAGRLAPDARAAQTLDAARAWALARNHPDGALKALSAAGTSLRGLPVAAFPAVAHVALTGVYARGGHPGELEKRARILLAVLTGRIG